MLKEGDTPVVGRLDRLGRSMPHLVTLVEDLRGRGGRFRLIRDGVMDMTNASGELLFNIFSALAQFGCRLIRGQTGGADCSSGSWSAKWATAGIHA